MLTDDLVIDARSLTKHFGETKAVDGLDLVVRRGEMFCLVGPDGAGKTTAMRILTGVTQPTSGDARVLGFDVVTEIGQIKSRIGYLSQRFSLYGDLTIDENIEFFAEIHHVYGYRARREELLEFTRLASFRDRLAERLSGGMKQKLALACTLVHTPEILFLDEPTTGVDPVSRRDFWKILSNLLKTGITIVMSTPYLDEAERCSRVGLMNRGSFLIVDTPQNVKAQMKGTVLEIICSDTRKAFTRLKAAPSLLEVQAFGDRLNVVVENEQKGIRIIQKALGEEDLELIEWRTIPSSLENVFISLLKSPN